MSGENPNSRANKTGLCVSGALLSFALVVALVPLPFSPPFPSAAKIPDWATDTAPVRRPKPEPVYSWSAFAYHCSDCHRIIPPPSGESIRTPVQHSEIVLAHGINTRCLNCHHPVSRDAFVNDEGGEIPWNQPQLVCAKCHGPVYRDWQHGSHGRTNGYWDKTRGPQSRRKCIECHDPHQPPFPPMKPAPAPHTLRMGQKSTVEHAESDNPLRLSRKAGRGAVGVSEEEP